MESIQEAVNRAIAAYEVIKTKPWYTRWLWIVVALVLSLLAAMAISKGTSEIARKKQMQREAKATLLRETLKAAKIEDKNRKAEYVAKLAKLNKQLKEAERATDKQAAELSKHIESIDKAKNWKELSKAMENN